MFDDLFAQLPSHGPRDAASLPGLRLWGVVPKWALLFPLLFAALFLVFLLSIMNADPRMKLALGVSETVRGSVVSVATVSSCQGSGAHRVTYTFTANGGKEYRGAATLCDWSQDYPAQVGDGIQVKFAPSNPAINGLASADRSAPPPLGLFLAMPLFFLVMFASLIWPALRDIVQARRLFMNGRLATGRVVFVKPQSMINLRGLSGVPATQVFIQIPTATGGTREAVAVCRNGSQHNVLP